MSPDTQDWEYNNLRYLGGQIAKKTPDFQDICTTDPNMAVAIYFLKHMKDFESEKDEEKTMLQIMMFLGKVNRTKFFSEITFLSAILGDTEDEWDTTPKE